MNKLVLKPTSLLKMADYTVSVGTEGNRGDVFVAVSKGPRDTAQREICSVGSHVKIGNSFWYVSEIQRDTDQKLFSVTLLKSEF